MEAFWITFRLKSDATYDARYQALIDAVHAHVDTHWWFEPTSFWLIRSHSSRAQIAASIKAAIAPAKDLVLIGSMEYQGVTVIGLATNLATLVALEARLIRA